MTEFGPIPKAVKDIIFRIETIVNNLNSIVSLRTGLKVEKVKEITDILNILDELNKLFNKFYEENKGLHRLVDRLINELNSIVNSVNSIRSKYFQDIQSMDLENLITNFEHFEKEWAFSIKKLSEIDVLSIEIDECSELRQWKDVFLKIRDVVQLIVWITYLMPIYKIVLEITKKSDLATKLIQFFIKRLNIINIMVRTLFK